jgi:hypothetical protein
MLRKKIIYATSVIILPLLLNGNGCDPLNIGQAAQTLQRAIDELSQQSEEWQQTLQKLEKDLVMEGQSTLSTEVTQLAQRGIATGGTEIKCTADFVGNRMKEGLIAIRDRITHHVPAPLRQFFCQVVPTSINLALPPDRRLELDFYGYNLDAGRVNISVIDSAGNTRVIENSPLIVGTPTHYLLTVNLSPQNGLKLNNTDQQIIFLLNPGLDTAEKHEVNIEAATPVPVFSVGQRDPKPRNGGGGIASAPVDKQCPAGNVGVGIQGRSGQFVDQIELLCSPLNNDGSLGPRVGLGAEGGGGGNPYSQICPGSNILVGFVGHSSGNLDSIGGQCKQADAIVGQSGVVTQIGPNGGDGGASFSNACLGRQAVTGLRVFAGGDATVVTRIDFFCSVIQLQ